MNQKLSFDYVWSFHNIHSISFHGLFDGKTIGLWLRNSTRNILWDIDFSNPLLHSTEDEKTIITLLMLM